MNRPQQVRKAEDEVRMAKLKLAERPQVPTHVASYRKDLEKAQNKLKVAEKWKDAPQKEEVEREQPSHQKLNRECPLAQLILDVAHHCCSPVYPLKCLRLNLHTQTLHNGFV